MSYFKNLKIEATKFSVVSCINFMITFAVFATMLNFLKCNYLLSLAVAWVFGVVFSYLANLHWVFTAEDKFKPKTGFLKFFVAGLFSVVCNMVVLELLVTHADISPFWGQLFLIPFVAVFNFASARLWAFRVIADS